MNAEQVSLFENARSEWSLHVTGPEMRRVMQTMASMNHGVPDPVMWVQKIGPATRRWFSNSFKLHTYFDTAGTDVDPETAVALPLSFLAAVNQLTNTYGAAEIFLNLAEDVLTGTSGGEYVVVDETVDVDSPPPFDPRFMDVVSGHRRFERVTVRSDVLGRIIDQYQSMFHSIDDIDGPPAFIRMVAEHDCIRWTTDWSRWERPRLSGYSVASTWINHFDIKFYPFSLFNLVAGIPHEEELVIGTVDAEFSEGKQYFSVIGLDWAAWCPVEDENWERWGRRIHRVFTDFGFEYEGADEFVGRFSEGETRTFRNDDVEILVSIIDGAAGIDCVRLSYEVHHSSNITLGVLQEVMQINSELVNARLTIDDMVMALVVDADNVEKPEDIGNALKSMLVAIGRVTEVDELLPLFGGHRPKDDLDREIDEILDSIESDGDADAPDQDDVPND
jgi:hypothetical protein